MLSQAAKTTKTPGGGSTVCYKNRAAPEKPFIRPFAVMASTVSLEHGAKKLAVKATPGRTLAEILAEFCDKYGLKPEEHALNFKQKNVDLSLPFRLSGIPQNAKLEVVKRPKSAIGPSSPPQHPIYEPL